MIWNKLFIRFISLSLPFEFNQPVEISYEEDNQSEMIAIDKPDTKKRKITGSTDWTLDQVFETKADLNDFLKNEKVWSISHSSTSDQCMRRYYRCNLVKKNEKQCAARLLVVEKSQTTDFEMFSSSTGHTHSDIANKLEYKVRDDVLNLSKGGMMPIEIFRFLKEKPIEGLNPTLSQIQNIVNYHNRSKENQPVVSVGDVVTWMRAHDKTSNESDLDEPYVIGYDHSSPESTSCYFHYVVSTKRLMNNASSFSNIAVDATYKVVYQGYPLLIVGSVDANRKFHLIAAALCVSEKATDYQFLFQIIQKSIQEISSNEFLPKTLISDASPAIINAFNDTFESATSNVICWAHMKRNMYNKTSDAGMLTDIDKLQLAPDPKVFKKGSKLFLKKWMGEHPIFCKYLEKNWFKKNSSWYEGYALRTPSTNNALESINNLIKKKYTMRKRLDISRFNVQLFQFVNDMAKSYSNGNSFALSPNITREHWQDAILLARNVKRYHILGSIDGVSQTVYIPSSDYLSANNNHRMTKEDVERIIEKQPKDFDNLMSNIFSIWKIVINTEGDNFQSNTSSCTCPQFLKYYLCKHILCMALRLHLLKAPADANPNKLGEKKKRGRPKLAKKALVVQ